jgi:hypothetical protein
MASTFQTTTITVENLQDEVEGNIELEVIVDEEDNYVSISVESSDSILAYFSLDKNGLYSLRSAIDLALKIIK